MASEQTVEAQRRRDREKGIAKAWLVRRYKVSDADAERLIQVLERKYEDENPVIGFLMWLIVYVVESGLLDLLIGLLEAGEPLPEV